MIVTLRRCFAAGAVAFVLGQTLHASEVEAPVQKFFPAAENGVPGSYGATLFSVPAASASAEIVSSVGGTLEHIYQYVLNGFQATLTAEQAEQLSLHPMVKDVVQETYLVNPTSGAMPYCYSDYTANTRDLPELPSSGTPVQTQELDCVDPNTGLDCDDNWGLDRTDETDGPPRDGYFSYRQTGSNVVVYVIDTGVAADNREFDRLNPASTRVTQGLDTNSCADFPDDCPPGDVPCTNNESPGKGHGTHVAGIIGGRTYGFARDVTIFPIKALCGTGEPGQPWYTTADFKRALEAVYHFHLIAQGQGESTAIVNISGFNEEADCYYGPLPYCSNGEQVQTAMTNLALRDDLLIVQSAGNLRDHPSDTSNDACLESFGNELVFPDTGDPPTQQDALARILVVGGSEISDAEGEFPLRDGLWRSREGEEDDPLSSNIGACIDVFAPAGRIVSSFYPLGDPVDIDEAVCQLSGTSMAAPHVSGVAAMILHGHPTMKVDMLRQLILNWAEQGVLPSNTEDPAYIGSGSPNLLLHWDPRNIMRDGFETDSYVLWNEVEP